MSDSKTTKKIVTFAILGGLAYYFYPKKAVNPAEGVIVKATEEPIKLPEWPDWLLKAGEENIEKLKEDKPVVYENPMTYQDYMNFSNMGENLGNLSKLDFSDIKF